MKPSIEFPQFKPSAEYMYGAKSGLLDGDLLELRSLIHPFMII